MSDDLRTPWTPRVVWFRRDLRHPTLHATLDGADDDTRIVQLFVWDPAIAERGRVSRRIGCMHTRVRMIVASFLCKDLLIDWRIGERHFLRDLIDGDLASNNGSWQ